MKRRFLIFALITAVIVASCNLQGSPPTELPPSQPTLDVPVTGATSSTPIPLETLLSVVEIPTITPTSTPSVTLASPREQPVNCRFGPDVSYAVIGALNPGRQAEVIGKNIDITWVFVRNPSDPSTSCWLSVDFININGDVELLPVVGSPEIRVTSILVSIEPPAMNVACDAFPQSVIISAQITTNGPAIVTWFWKSSVDKTSPQKQMLFEQGDVKTAQDYYQVDRAGDYSIQVQSILPNITTGEANFKVICTP